VSTKLSIALNAAVEAAGREFIPAVAANAIKGDTASGEKRENCANLLPLYYESTYYESTLCTLRLRALLGQKEENPNMNTTLDHPRAELTVTTAQETVQTVLLIIISFVGYMAKSLQNFVASVWRPMPSRRRCHGGRRHLPVANALAGIAWSDL
jgi:hypothetical protein